MGTRILMMPEKFIRTGSSPVYDEKNEAVANINYSYFSFNRHVEITGTSGEVISSGGIKILSLRPTWLIYDRNGNHIGSVKREFALFANNFFYENNREEHFEIEGNIRARDFTVSRNGNEVLRISSTASLISLLPQSFAVEIIDNDFDLYEAINLVEGVRSLVEIARESRH